MRKPRGRGERLLEDALEDLGRALNSLRVPWMLIGGLAVIARGVRRFTTDIDAVVQGDSVDIDTLVRILQRHKIVPRIPDPTSFAARNLILLVTHEPSGVDLDISMGWTGFEREALTERSPVAFGTVKVPVASPEDLLIFKIVAGRPIDLDDAKALLALYPKIDLARVRMRVRELADLMEESGRVATLERLLRDVIKTPSKGSQRVVNRPSRGKRPKAKPQAPKRKLS